jgi:SAM-dependent methyltransferase
VKENILYTDLANWWPLCSAPAEYRQEARIYRQALLSNSRRKPVTVLELGSGGGNNASHLKQYFRLTLVDRSPGMLAVSKSLNPECEHLRGDMRRVRLGRLFDAVFIHDAIDYMATLVHLRQAIRTAYIHCRPGGVALFVPDWTAERFRPASSFGGHDSGDRGLRYLEWNIDHDPTDSQYTLYLSYLLREGKRVRQVALDKHTCGLFPEREWVSVIRQAGFLPHVLPYRHSGFERHPQVMFLGLKPE